MWTLIIVKSEDDILWSNWLYWESFGISFEDRYYWAILQGLPICTHNEDDEALYSIAFNTEKCILQYRPQLNSNRSCLIHKSIISFDMGITSLGGWNTYSFHPLWLGTSLWWWHGMRSWDIVFNCSNPCRRAYSAFQCMPKSASHQQDVFLSLGASGSVWKLSDQNSRMVKSHSVLN